VPCSGQDFMPSKMKDMRKLAPGIRAKHCWCDNLTKVKEAGDFSDK
jgi:hypothetical protein